MTRPRPLHYRAYAVPPLSAADRSQVEVLFGGLPWRTERLTQAVFENLGYKARPLPPATRADLSRGRELTDIGQCCPTSFTTGNLLNFLESEVARIGTQAVCDRYVYVTVGSCGACRFGQYHQSHELALRNVGLEAFRRVLVDQHSLETEGPANGGLDINMPLTLGVIWAILCADVIQSLEYQTRPYEVKSGSTDDALRKSIDYLSDVFRRRPTTGRKWGSAAWHLSTGYFVQALRDVFRNFETIQVDRLRPKPVVKLTGEFYLQTVEGEPNYNMHTWLESEGAEVVPAPIAVWFDYLLRFRVQACEERIGIDAGARVRAAALRATQRLLRWTYNRMRAACGGIPHGLPDQYELSRLAAPYYHHRLSGGEGDMLIGKVLWAHKRRKAHMICELSPYGCMPTTMSIGAMAGVLGHYPHLLYAPIEVKGDADAHALSRCQMILTEAKARAMSEYDRAAEVTGLTPEKARSLLADTPAISRATYRVPHCGAAGMAANTLLHLAGQRLPGSDTFPSRETP